MKKLFLYALLSVSHLQCMIHSVRNEGCELYEEEMESGHVFCVVKKINQSGRWEYDAAIYKDERRINTVNEPQYFFSALQFLYNLQENQSPYDD